MKRTTNDPRYQRAIAENEGDSWYADTVVAPIIDREVVAANRAAFIAEWAPVFTARRAAWNALVAAEPTISIPERECRLGFTMADLQLAKSLLVK